MAVLFAGGELPSFKRFNAVESTLADSFRAPARCGIHTQKNGWIKTTPLGNRSDLWIHFELNIGLRQSGKTPLIIENSAGSALFSIDSNGTISAATVINTINIFGSQGRFTYDVHVRGGSSGLIEVYVDSQLMYSYTGSLTTLTTMDAVSFNPVGDDSTATTNTIWSQIIIADEITVGWKLATLTFDANGAQTGFIGGASDINEIVLDDNTYISANQAGLISTWTTSDLDTPYTSIKAVVISALGKYTSTGPRNIDAVCRIGGVNYFSAMPALGLGFTPSQIILHNNPNGSIPWSRTVINASEFGLRSKV